MPVVIGEPSGSQPASNPGQVVGPFTFQGSLAANTSATLRVPAATGNSWTSIIWNYIFARMLLRGISGTINANGVAAGQTLTISPAAAASAVNGTETGSNLAGASYATNGGTNGFFSLDYGQPIGLPFTAGGGTLLAGNLIATGAGAVDLCVWLHLEA